MTTKLTPKTPKTKTRPDHAEIPLRWSDFPGMSMREAVLNVIGTRALASLATSVLRTSDDDFLALFRECSAGMRLSGDQLEWTKDRTPKIVISAFGGVTRVGVVPLENDLERQRKWLMSRSEKFMAMANEALEAAAEKLFGENPMTSESESLKGIVDSLNERLRSKEQKARSASAAEMSYPDLKAEIVIAVRAWWAARTEAIATEGRSSLQREQKAFMDLQRLAKNLAKMEEPKSTRSSKTIKELEDELVDQDRLQHAMSGLRDALRSGAGQGEK